MRIELENGSVIEVPENVDITTVRGQGTGLWWISDEDDKNDENTDCTVKE